MIKKLALAAGLWAAGTLLVLVAPAQASLIGQTVNCFQLGDGTPGGGFLPCRPRGSAIVGPVAEFNTGEFSIDLGAESVTLRELAPVNFGSTFFLTLTDLVWSNDPTATITGIANFSASGVTGMEESDVSVFDNAIVLNYTNTRWSSGSIVSFDLVTSHRQLPEPASLALLGIGLLGLGVAVRRKGHYMARLHLQNSSTPS